MNNLQLTTAIPRDVETRQRRYLCARTLTGALRRDGIQVEVIGPDISTIGFAATRLSFNKTLHLYRDPGLRILPSAPGFRDVEKFEMNRMATRSPYGNPQVAPVFRPGNCRPKKGMHMNALLDLHKHNQSVWLDYIRRDLVLGGELKRLVEQDGVGGVTSNPAIFEKAIDGRPAIR